MRTILPHHKDFVREQDMKRLSLDEKKVSAVLKAHDNAKKLVKDNELCEAMLKQVSNSNHI